MKLKSEQKDVLVPCHNWRLTGSNISSVTAARKPKFDTVLSYYILICCSALYNKWKIICSRLYVQVLVHALFNMLITITKRWNTNFDASCRIMLHLDMHIARLCQLGNNRNFRGNSYWWKYSINCRSHRRRHHFESGVQNNAANKASRKFFGLYPDMCDILGYAVRKRSQKKLSICLGARRQSERQLLLVPFLELLCHQPSSVSKYILFINSLQNLFTTVELSPEPLNTRQIFLHLSGGFDHTKSRCHFSFTNKNILNSKLNFRFIKTWMTPGWHLNIFYPSEMILLPNFSITSHMFGWLGSSVIERRSLTGELSLVCTWPEADG